MTLLFWTQVAGGNFSSSAAAAHTLWRCGRRMSKRPFALPPALCSKQSFDLAGSFFLVCAKLEQLIILVVVQPLHLTPEAKKKLRATLHGDWICLQHTGFEYMPYAFNGIQIWRAFGEFFYNRTSSSRECLQVPVLPKTPFMILHQVAFMVVPEAVTTPLGKLGRHELVVPVSCHVGGLVSGSSVILGKHPILQPPIGQKTQDFHWLALRLRIERRTDVIVPESIFAIRHSPDPLPECYALVIASAAWTTCKKPGSSVGVGNSCYPVLMPRFNQRAILKPKCFVSRCNPRLAASAQPS